MGAYSKVPKGRETTDGGVTPGNCATTRKVPKGRQRYKQFDIKQVMYSVALSGLSFVNAFVPGVNTPVCGLSRLGRFFPGQQLIKEKRI